MFLLEEMDSWTEISPIICMYEASTHHALLYVGDTKLAIIYIILLQYMSDIYTAGLCWLVGISCVCMFSYNPCFNSFSLFHRPSLSLRFHLLDEFDDAKKSCRKRLADHNRRRRKSKPSDADAGDKKRAHANKAAAAKDST